MKPWMEKHTFLLNWAWKLSIPLALLLGNYMISYFGIETRAHAKETFQDKNEQVTINTNNLSLIQAQNLEIAKMKQRQLVDHENIAQMHKLHKLYWKEYPAE